MNAFFVARRINKFRIRAALGATQGNLQRLVLADGLRFTAAGPAAGAAALMTLACLLAARVDPLALCARSGAGRRRTASSLTGWRDLDSKSLRRGHTV